MRNYDVKWPRRVSWERERLGDIFYFIYLNSIKWKAALSR